MELKNFDYYLPKNLIAQKPLKSRDQAGLLVLNRKTKKTSHRKFFELPKFLQAGDVLVLNDTKVFAARLIGKKETDGKIEVFLLKPDKNKTWQVLLGGNGRKENLIIKFKHDLKGKVIKKLPDRTWLVQFSCSNKKLMETAAKIGEAPVPPYIKTKSNLKEYQTVYAKHLGSVAATTAGFHFTKKLLKQLKKQGVQIEYVTLHVGLGTFEPVRTNKIEDHKMHVELAMLNKSTAQRLNQAKKEGRRIIAVGTTTTRVLESFAKKISTSYQLQAKRSNINTFIYPGYKFKTIDALITNFHLPKSTLIMLVSAFAESSPSGSSEASSPGNGIRLIKKAYREAIQKKYRFYSFGDAMLIL